MDGVETQETPSSMTANVKTLGQFAKLYKESKGLETKLKALKQKLDEMEPEIVEYMQRNNTQSHNVNGVTLSVRRELWPGMRETSTVDSLVSALDQAGLGGNAGRRMNVQSMRAVVNETVGDAQGDPESIFHERYPMLADHLKVSEVFKLGKRLSS